MNFRLSIAIAALAFAGVVNAQTQFPAIQVNGQADLRGNVVDTTGNLTLNDAVDITGGKLTTLATALGGAGLNLPAGTAPSSPVNGDMWTTTAGVFARINGVTVGPFGGSSFPLLAPNGSLGAPSYSFSGLTTSGMWLDGTSLGLTPNAYTTRWGVNINPTGTVAETFLGGAMNPGSALMWGNTDGSGAEIIFVPNETGIDATTRFFSVFAGANGSNGQLGIASPWGLPFELFSDAGGATGIVSIGVNGSDYVEIRSNVRADAVNPLRLFSPSAVDQFIDFEADNLLMSFTDGTDLLNGDITANVLNLRGVTGVTLDVDSMMTTLMLDTTTGFTVNIPNASFMLSNTGEATLNVLDEFFIIADDLAVTATTTTIDGDLTVLGTCTGCGSTTPGGADTQVQYNDGGAFGGDAGMVFNETTNALTITGIETNAGLVSDPGGGTDELTVTSGAVAINGTLTDDGVNLDAATGTFTLSFTDACSTTPTMQLRYNKVGNMVLLTGTSSGDAFNCTSDSTGFADPGGNVTAAVRPTSTVEIPVYALDNTAVAYGVMLITSAGNVQINRCDIYGGAGNPCVGAWTSSGTKGLNNITGAYNINN